MNTSRLPIALALSVTVLALVSAQAFTDTNADLKEAAVRHRPQRAVKTFKAVPPAQTAWVPVSSKRLDGFEPVLPASPEVAQTLARAELPVAIKRRAPEPSDPVQR